jgi:hypothetical protein
MLKIASSTLRAKTKAILDWLQLAGVYVYIVATVIIIIGFEYQRILNSLLGQH